MIAGDPEVGPVAFATHLQIPSGPRGLRLWGFLQGEEGLTSQKNGLSALSTLVLQREQISIVEHPTNIEKHKFNRNFYLTPNIKTVVISVTILSTSVCLTNGFKQNWVHTVICCLLFPFYNLLSLCG